MEFDKSAHFQKHLAPRRVWRNFQRSLPGRMIVSVHYRGCYPRLISASPPDWGYAYPNTRARIPF
jgi:hypothetical protein